MKANFVWDLPDLKSEQPSLRAIGYVINDWQLSGIWTASTAGSYTVSQNYQSGSVVRSAAVSCTRSSRDEWKSAGQAAGAQRVIILAHSGTPFFRRH